MEKLSSQLHDAIIFGNKERADEIRNEIALRSNIVKKAQNNTILINTILNDEKTSAINVYNFLNKVFGESWWEWEFETIERLLWIKYNAALESINRDKIFAIRHVCRSDGAFTDWFEFNQVALSFSGCIADFEYLRNPSPGMVINAVKTLNHIRPDRNGSFGNDVLKYICICLINDGVYSPPPSLVFLIKDIMKGMVAQSTSSNWLSIMKRYNKFKNNMYSSVDENLIDIQAKRLLKAEKAASAYAT